MKAVCISDTHCMHDRVKLPSGELLIHAGDACGFGNQKEFFQFASWFRVLPFEYKVFVAGNHDKYVENNRDEALAMLGSDVHYLQDSMAIINGFTIWGSPWQPPFCNWAFNLTEDKLALAFDLIPEELDLLITHGPPNGCGDTLPLGEHIGSFALARKLHRLEHKPRFHVFGHCHNGYGVHLNHGIVAANAAICNEQYKPIHPPIVLSL